jgi:3-deoxy-D-manno-octulosonate 8-phosphate phosphatase (KDO 8-P phosphatase)
LPVLLAVGLAACPADAALEVKKAAQLLTQAPGGRGAIREVVEFILGCQGRWTELVGAAFGAGEMPEQVQPRLERPRRD